MSWQAYVDTNLLGSGRVSKAAILGQQGGVWATSAGYSLTPDEQTAIIDAFKNPEKTLASGIRAAGQKFFAISATDSIVMGKKQADGIILAKTKQAIIVGEYVAPIQAPETNIVVEGLADYLKSVGY